MSMFGRGLIKVCSGFGAFPSRSVTSFAVTRMRRSSASFASPRGMGATKPILPHMVTAVGHNSIHFRNFMSSSDDAAEMPPYDDDKSTAVFSRDELNMRSKFEASKRAYDFRKRQYAFGDNEPFETCDEILDKRSRFREKRARSEKVLHIAEATTTLDDVEALAKAMVDDCVEDCRYTAMTTCNTVEGITRRMDIMDYTDHQKRDEMVARMRDVLERELKRRLPGVEINLVACNGGTYRSFSVTCFW